jgi:hypothetical protein
LVTVTPQIINTTHSTAACAMRNARQVGIFITRDIGNQRIVPSSSQY